MARRGSNKAKGLSYRVNKTRERNMARNIERHLKSNPNDEQSKKALADISSFIRKAS